VLIQWHNIQSQSQYELTGKEKIKGEQSSNQSITQSTSNTITTSSTTND